MNWKTLIAAIALTSLSACATAGGMMHEPPGGDYKHVSDLVPLPPFIPGLGSLYVQPKTLPVGPFLAYDHDGKLVATIYMVPLKAMQDQTKYAGLAVGDQTTRKVDMYYNAGHPGVPEPHYHIVLWHVDPATAKLK